MKLTVIGCSGSMSGKDSPASSYLLQAIGPDADNERVWSIIIDFGPGAMGHLLRYADPARIDGMFLSHLHADHCADIVGMQVYRRWYPEGALGRIPVFSPGDGAARTRGIADDPVEETYAGEFEFHQVKPADTVRLGPFDIEFFAGYHTVPAVAMRITGPSESDPAKRVTMTYTGDTDYVSSVVDAARGVDLLLSEAAFEEGRDSVEGVHLTGKRAGILAAEAGVGRLLLTHLQPWTSPQRNVADARAVYDGDVAAVSAGDVYAI
ncbi:MBL fold metallo-hydrolase [Trueperella pyogenes]|uniref:MBL fold metallo-hydrolase n=1 Tax=Trueperella pyogenes TaxID=1661 RepID=A0ABV3N9W6_9ACTO|nr:MBL fold metallo-hydrolase [Trueperella pyogenes]MCI7690192.1 MBL fold metallo-hydrolase [Trueperella pyogenes]